MASPYLDPQVPMTSTAPMEIPASALMEVALPHLNPRARTVLKGSSQVPAPSAQSIGFLNLDVERRPHGDGERLRCLKPKVDRASASTASTAQPAAVLISTAEGADRFSASVATIQGSWQAQ